METNKTSGKKFSSDDFCVFLLQQLDHDGGKNQKELIKKYFNEMRCSDRDFQFKNLLFSWESYVKQAKVHINKDLETEIIEMLASIALDKKP